MFSKNQRRSLEMRKRFGILVLVLIVSLCLGILLTGCKDEGSINGKYYEEKFDGTLNESSWIELSKKKWTDDEGETGTFELSGTKITFFQDGEDLFDGTLENGVLTIEFFGTTVYRKEPAQKTDNNNNGGSNNGGGNNDGGSATDNTPTPETEIAKLLSMTDGEISGLTVSMEVSEGTTQIDLSGRVTVSEGASWQLYLDVTGQTLIPTKYAANLQNGDNIYYIVVNSADNTVNRTYTLSIYKNHYVTITYKSQDAVYDTEQKLTHTKLGVGPSISRDGYTFNGWGSSGHFVTGAETFYASWTANKYTVNLDKNGGMLSSSTQTLTYGNNYTLPVPTRTEYSFMGWYTSKTGGVRMTNHTGKSEWAWNITNNTTVYAQWSINSYTVNTNKNISNAGTASGGGSKEYNSSVTITATTNAGYTWLGWYDGDTKVSTGSELTYTFTMPAENKTYEARWELTERGNYDTDGYTQVGEYIWFGEYPQSIKASNVSVGTTADSRGYYLGDDGYYYAKVTATPNDSGYKFSTGTTVTSGTVYYFKVERIKWRILSESNGNALILCESIIANKRYHASSNNYMNSEIRAWLNDEFYNTAFSSLQQQLIQETNVDNSVYSTGSDSNPYACANTDDKIFLPSYRDVVNTSYGFNSSYSAYDTARRRLTSDYSRATGAYMYTTDSSYYGNGMWWLRSPYSDDSYSARYIFSDGYVSSGRYVSRSNNGVVPALTIKLS